MLQIYTYPGWGRITVSVNDIVNALLGSEKAFIQQASEKIEAWKRSYTPKNDHEREYLTRMATIPFSALNANQYFLRLRSALDDGYELIKESMRPFRISIIKLMKQYNEEKIAENKLKSIFSVEASSAILESTSHPPIFRK